MNDNGVREGKIDELITDRKNANKGTQTGLRALDKSLRDLGAGRSILVDKHGEIIAGNKTTERAADLGIEDVIIVPTDGTKLVAVQRTDLDLEKDPEARQLAYADNRIAELDLDWDYEQVDFDMGEGLDLEWLGFEMEQEPEDDPGAQVDRAEELREKWGVETGQLWRLGEHRLICGDCTDAEIVDRVMDGEKADCTVTDPPYGIGVDYGEFEDTSDNVKELISKIMPIIFEYLPAAFTPGFPAVFDYPVPTWLGAWVHPAPANRCPWGFVGHNPILFYGDDPYLKTGRGCRPDSVVMAADRQGENTHPTSKPIKVWEWLVERLSPEKDEIIFDPFIGSGTTIIACERLGRKCRAVEVSPAYCAVAIQRWVDMTGGEPTLIEDS